MNETTKLYDYEDLKDQDIEALLDLPFSEIAKTKSFITPPKGSYIFDVVKCAKGVVGQGENETPAVIMHFSLNTVVEMLHPEDDKEPEVGSLVNLSYLGGSSIQRIRTIYGEIAVALQAENLGQLLEKFEGCKIACVVGHRKNKQNADEPYPTFSEVSLVQ